MSRRLENLVRKAFRDATIKRYTDAARFFRGSQGAHTISNATVRDILLELDFLAAQRVIGKGNVSRKSLRSSVN